MIKRYIEFMKESKEKSGNLYKYGCVMLELNIANWEEITSTIDPNDVYLPEDPSHGVETQPHVTILYGLHKGVTPEQVKSVFDDFHGDIKVTIDGVGIFENEEFDVVKLNVVPDGSIQQLHDELKKFPNSDEYPTYHPHITLAYVKKGTGKKYVNPSYKHTLKDIGKVKYSTPEGEKVYFDINTFNGESLEYIMSIPILERRGIPSILKNLYKEIKDNIISNISNGDDIKKFNLLGNDINIKLTNSKIPDIRGISKRSHIELEFDFENYSKIELGRVILHELTHIYEINKRISKGSKNKLQWDISKILMNIRDRYSNDKFISSLIYTMYHSLDHEINARVSEVYSILIGLKSMDKSLLLKSLKNTNAWMYKEYLKNYNLNYNEINYGNLMEFLNDFNSEVILKFKNINFNIYKIPNNEKECNDILRSWKFLFKKKAKHYELKLVKIIDEVIDDILLDNSAYVEKVGEEYITKFDKKIKRDILIKKVLR